MKPAESDTSSSSFTPARRVRFAAIGEAYSWWKRAASVWTVATLVQLILMTVPVFLVQLTLYPRIANWAIGHAATTYSDHLAVRPYMLPIWVLFTALYWCFDGGLYRLALNQLRGQPADLMTVFSQFRLFPALLWMSAASHLSWYAIALVATPLIKNGTSIWIYQLIWLIFGTPFLLTLPLMVDKGLPSRMAVSASVKALLPRYPAALLFALLSYLIYYLGALACFVGIFVTMPLFPLAMTVLYRDLFEEIPDSAAA